MIKIPPARFYLMSVFPASVWIYLILLPSTFYAIDLGARAWQVGLMGSSVLGAYALLCPVMARVPLKIWAKVGIALTLYTCLPALALLAGNFWHLWAVVIWLGCAGALYWPSVEVALCEGRPAHEITKNLGSFNISWGTGVFVGALVSGRIYEFDPHLPFIIASAAALIALALLFHLPRPLPAPITPAPAEQAMRDVPPPDAARSFVRLCLLLNFLTYFTVTMLLYLFPTLGVRLEFKPGSVSFLIALSLLSQIVVFYGLRNTRFWHYRLWPMMACTLTAVACFFVIGSVRQYWVLALAFLLVGLYRGVSSFNSLFYSMVSPVSRARSAARHEMVVGLGCCLGPIAGGLLAEVTDLSAPFLLCSFVALAAFGIEVRFLLRQTRKRRAER